MPTMDEISAMMREKYGFDPSKDQAEDFMGGADTSNLDKLQKELARQGHAPKSTGNCVSLNQLTNEYAKHPGQIPQMPTTEEINDCARTGQAPRPTFK